MCVFVTTLLVTYRLKLLHLCFKMTGIEVVLPDGEKKKSKVMVLSGHKFLIFLPVPVLLSALIKEKVWEWYGKGWAISDPYVEMVWEGCVMIWN